MFPEQFLVKERISKGCHMRSVSKWRSTRCYGYRKNTSKAEDIVCTSILKNLHYEETGHCYLLYNNPLQIEIHHNA